MKEVNVTELREHLPSYLAAVKRGQRIVVTSRGRAVAELGPPRASSDEVTAARQLLRGSVVRYEDPLKPAFESSEWEALE
jgi:prevent-host-death family protein